MDIALDFQGFKDNCKYFIVGTIYFIHRRLFCLSDLRFLRIIRRLKPENRLLGTRIMVLHRQLRSIFNLVVYLEGLERSK